MMTIVVKDNDINVKDNYDNDVDQLTSWTFQDYTRQFSVMCAGCKKVNFNLYFLSIFHLVC